MQEPFIFTLSEARQGQALLCSAWDPHTQNSPGCSTFPALTDKTHRANLLQTGILAFVSLPACLRQRKTNFHIKY